MACNIWLKTMKITIPNMTFAVWFYISINMFNYPIVHVSKCQSAKKSHKVKWVCLLVSVYNKLSLYLCGKWKEFYLTWPRFQCKNIYYSKTVQTTNLLLSFTCSGVIVSNKFGWNFEFVLACFSLLSNLVGFIWWYIINSIYIH